MNAQTIEKELYFERECVKSRIKTIVRKGYNKLNLFFSLNVSFHSFGKS